MMQTGCYKMERLLESYLYIWTYLCCILHYATDGISKTSNWCTKIWSYYAALFCRRANTSQWFRQQLIQQTDKPVSGFT